jgi:preprotein translocase subunit SecB
MAKPVSNEAILSEKGIEWSFEVARHARLTDVRVISCECKSAVPQKAPLPTEAMFAVQSMAKTLEIVNNNPGVFVDTFIRLEMGYKPESGNTGGVTIQVQQRSTYEFDGPHKFSDAQMRSFSSWDSQTAVWPFLHEFVNSLTVRMGFPPYHIPSHDAVIESNLRKLRSASRLAGTRIPSKPRVTAGTKRKRKSKH